jgi:hypothetical protein
VYDCVEEGRVFTKVQRRGRAQLFGSGNIRVVTIFSRVVRSNRFRIFQADLEGEQLADVGVYRMVS